MKKSVEVYIEYYHLQESMVDESSRVFFNHLDEIMLKEIKRYDGNLYHVTLTPERWKLFSEFETRYQLKKEADRKVYEELVKELDREKAEMAIRKAEAQSKVNRILKSEEKESFDFRELEVLR